MYMYMCIYYLIMKYTNTIGKVFAETINDWKLMYPAEVIQSQLSTPPQIDTNSVNSNTANSDYTHTHTVNTSVKPKYLISRVNSPPPDPNSICGTDANNSNSTSNSSSISSNSSNLCVGNDYYPYFLIVSNQKGIDNGMLVFIYRFNYY